MHLLHRLASLCKARGVLFKQVFFVGVPKMARKACENASGRGSSARNVAGQTIALHGWQGHPRAVHQEVSLQEGLARGVSQRLSRGVL